MPVDPSGGRLPSTSWVRRRPTRDASNGTRSSIEKIGDLAAAAGLRRIHMLSWRDLADVEAGGSEVHAATVAKLWAEAGIDVTLRTSYARGQAPVVTRDGYRVDAPRRPLSCFRAPRARS